MGMKSEKPVGDGIVYDKHVEGGALAAELSVATDGDGQRTYSPSEVGADGEVPFVKVQNGPLKEKMRNGLLIEELAAVLINELRHFNSGEFSCRDNSIAITHFEEGLLRLDERTRKRVARGVEGRNIA